MTRPSIQLVLLSLIVATAVEPRRQVADEADHARFVPFAAADY